MCVESGSMSHVLYVPELFFECSGPTEEGRKERVRRVFFIVFFCEYGACVKH